VTVVDWRRRNNAREDLQDGLRGMPKNPAARFVADERVGPTVRAPLVRRMAQEGGKMTKDEARDELLIEMALAIGVAVDAVQSLVVMGDGEPEAPSRRVWAARKQFIDAIKEDL